MQQVQNIHSSLGQPVLTRGPQRFLAVAHEHQRLVLAPITQKHLAHHPVKDHLGARPRRLIAWQTGPDLLVLGLWSRRWFWPISEENGHDFLSRAPMAVHRIYRADRRHAFPARLVPFGAMHLWRPGA